MSVPHTINDGNWSILSPDDTGRIEFPFSDRGDNTSWIEYIPYKQDRAFFRPRKPMTVVRGTLGTGFLVKQGNPQNIGCNLFQWEDIIAQVPQSRIEYGTFNYTYQWWRAATGSNVDASKYFYDVNFDIEEQTFTVAAEFQYEYFRDVAPEPLIKPRVFLLFGVLQAIGGTPILGNRLVAEDSTVEIWMGQIFVRRTAYVKVNSAGQLVG